MSSKVVKNFSGTGKVLKNDKYLCKVSFSYQQIGDPQTEMLRAIGGLTVDESERMSTFVLNNIMGNGLVLQSDNGEIFDIVVSGFKGGNQLSGRYKFLPAPGGFPRK